MIRIFESLLEESAKRKFIQKWNDELPEDKKIDVDYYDEVYEKNRQKFDNRVKKDGLNWQTSMTLEIFEEILNEIEENNNLKKEDREKKSKFEKAGRSKFLIYVLANPDCDLEYIGTENKWDFFNVNSWEGAKLADSSRASLSGSVGAQWCIGWKDPEKQMYDKYTSYGFNFVLAVKSNKSNTAPEEKYMIQMLNGSIEDVWDPQDDVISSSDMVKFFNIKESELVQVEQGYTDYTVFTQSRRLDIIGLDHNVIRKVIIRSERVDGTTILEDIDDISKAEEIELTEDVQYIHYGAFEEFAKLESITIPKSVIKIDKGAFQYCLNLKEMIWESDCKIPERCFYKCKSLSKVVINGNIKSISTEAFYECSSLKEIKLPESLVTIEDYSFSKTGLKYIKFPEFVERILEGAFCLCSNLVKVEMSRMMFKVCESAFETCKNLKEVVFNKGLMLIKEGAFKNCILLNNVVIPDNTEIEEFAFSGCTSLSNIVINENPKRSISLSAFKNCNISTDINFFNKNCILHEGLIISPDGKFLAATMNSKKIIEVPAGVIEIGDNAFSNTNVEEIILPNTITKIGDMAFVSCKIKKINIPEGVTYIGVNAFSNCNNLEEIVLPKSLKRIEAYAFFGDKSLKRVVLLGAKEVCPSVFSACDKLETIEFGEKDVKVYKNSFTDCFSLSDATIAQIRVFNEDAADKIIQNIEWHNKFLELPF